MRDLKKYGVGEHVYVSSCRRGFFIIADRPFCITTPTGSSTTGHLVGIKSVVFRNGEWHYADDYPPSLWLSKAWEEAVGLTGGEPWRIYALNAAQVTAALEQGVHIDDVRGFSNRCEPWQPKHLISMEAGERIVSAAHATIWERVDGWRVVRGENGWTADGSQCNASPCTLKYSPRHFDALEGTYETYEAAQAAVDKERPWS